MLLSGGEMMKEFRQEENGVRWLSERNGSNVVHHMEFTGRTLSGSWVGPRWVFQALVSMSDEERAKLVNMDHDEAMGIIRQHIRKFAIRSEA